jgi:hypothetical protein
VRDSFVREKGRRISAQLDTAFGTPLA